MSNVSFNCAGMCGNSLDRCETPQESVSNGSKFSHVGELDFVCLIKTCVEAGVLTVPSKPFGQMERKFGQFKQALVSTPEGAARLKEIFPFLLNDPVLSPLLQGYFECQKIKRGKSGLSNFEILQETLKYGTCLGQILNIIEILSSHDPLKCTEKFIIDQMDPYKCIRYQIMSIFLNDFEKLPNRPAAQMLVASLTEALPVAHKTKIVSEQLSLQHICKEDLAGRISAFVMQLRSEGENGLAIIIKLYQENSPLGHAALMYINEKQKRYYPKNGS